DDEHRALAADETAPQIDALRADRGGSRAHLNPLVGSLLRLGRNEAHRAAHEIEDQGATAPALLAQEIGNDQHGVLADCYAAAVLEGELDAGAGSGRNMIPAGDGLSGSHIVDDGTVALDAHLTARPLDNADGIADIDRSARCSEGCSGGKGEK